MTKTADVTIIGGGPIGLFGLYCAGLNGLRAQLLESLDRIGGQLEYLYPEKPIYDIGGFPKITGRELVVRLKEQAFQYGAVVNTGVQAHRLESSPAGHRIVTNRGVYDSRVVVVTAGIGEFVPRRINIPAVDQFEGRGLYYVVSKLAEFEDQTVLVVGGGDSAADWAMAIADRANAVVMIHRRPEFQCHRDSLEKLRAHPRVTLMPSRTLRAVVGADRIEGAVLQDAGGAPIDGVLAVSRVIVAIGLIPGTGVFQNWGLSMEGNEIRVATNMSTSVPGVYAAGDIAAYPGKVKLIASGFGEVATAMEAALTYLHTRPG